MNSFHRYIVAASIVLAASTHAVAAPAHPASVEQLLILTKSEQLLDVMHTNMEQGIRQGMLQSVGDRPLTAQQQRLLQTLPNRLSTVLRQELNWSTLKALLVPIYSSAFTQEEVDGLIEFYRSPLGQRFATRQPELAQRSGLAAQQLIARVVPRINAAMEAALKEAGIQ